MTFLAPVWLLVGGVAAAAVLGLHLLNRRRLRPLTFPTARFVPEAPVRAVSPTLVPTDIPLLLLRAAMVSLVAIALARPVGPAPRRTAVIALADRSPAPDSAAVGRMVADVTPDTVIDFVNLSAGLVAARRAAVRWADRADSVDLVVVSSLSAGLWDAATGTLREQWPGRVAVRRTGGQAVRPSAVQLAWSTGAAADTTAAVYAAGVAMVGRFARLTTDDERRTEGTAIAWFGDGTPAVMEYPSTTGCERVVAFKEPEGDALIRAAGLRFAERLAAPCGHGWTPEKFLPADPSLVRQLAGTGGAAAIDRLGDPEQPIPWWPLLLALVALAGERIVRRRIA